MFQHIVVPLDGSSLAEQALPVAARIARASGGSILLLRIVTPPTDSIWQYWDVSAGLANVVEGEFQQAENYVQHIAHSEQLKGIVVTTQIASHEPAQRILDISQANEADLIVLCSHGYTGVKRWMMGSVARQVARHSSIPVLLLRPDAQTSSKLVQETAGPLNILVPLDGSLMAEEALAPAASLATLLSAPQQGSLYLSSILPLSEPEEYAFTEKNQEMLIVQKYLTTLEQRLLQEQDARAKPAITTIVTSNPDIAHALVHLAESDEDGGANKCDVIAMATHGRGAIARWMMGSVAERVLEATNLPILIVRPHKMRARRQKEHQAETPAEQEPSGVQSWVGLL